VDYVYLWADGIHVNIRLEEHNLCLQVMIGVCADGRKDLIAPRGWLPWVHEVVGGHAARLRPPWHARPGAGCRGRGAGVLERAAGGVPAREGRCWFHKTANVLAALPQSVYPGAKKGLAEIWAPRARTTP
jgi:hypothetical protein